MNTDREIMQQALEAMGTVGADWICEASHHAKKDQHKWGEPCPLQQRWHIAYQALRERLAQPYPDNFIEALMYDVAKRDSEEQQAYEDAFVNGTGVMLGDKRIDSTSIYKEPEQEPVAWMHPDGRIWTFGRGLDKSTFTIPLYTTPQQRKPLTEEEIDELAMDKDGLPNSHIEFARAIERAHGIGEKPDAA